MPDTGNDEPDPPDHGLNERVDIGLAHIGLLLIFATSYAWFWTDQRSTFLDWFGLCLFVAGSRMWALDPPPVRLWKHPLAILVGAAGVAYGWWFQRLPITIAGAFLALAFPVTVLRRVFRRLW